MLGYTSPHSVLLSLPSLSSVQNIIDSLNGMHDALETTAEAVNALPAVFAADFPALPTEACYKPVSPTNDADK